MGGAGRGMVAAVAVMINKEQPEDEDPLLDVGSPVDLSRLPRLPPGYPSPEEGSQSPPARSLPFSVDNILDPNKFTGGKLTHWRPHEITRSSESLNYIGMQILILFNYLL